MRTQHRGIPEAPPLPESAFILSDDQEEGPSRSFLGHDMHFLERTARLPGLEIDRAMRLYRHSAIVKRVLAEKLPQQRDRVAIAISDAAPAAHVIVCADGVFVTCLSTTMHTGRVPVLPYQEFLPAMDMADAVHEQAATRRRQLALLDASHLTEALHRGPGHVDQEMVRIIERLPETYVVPVLFAAQHTMTRYLRLSKTSFKIECLLKRDRHDAECLALRQRLFRHLSLSEATVKMCLYLFGAMDSETITTWLGTFVRHPSPILPEMAFALARHRRGGELMLPYLQSAKPDSAVFRLRLHAVLHHIVYHPQHIPAVFSALKENGAYVAMAQAYEMPSAPELPTLTPEQAEQLSAAMLEKLPPLRAYPEDSHGLPDIGWIDDVGLRKGPVSALFPPRAQLNEVGRRWQEHLRNPPPIEASPVRTVVRTAPRVGRNEPCPCGSGRKHKHCCLDRASPCPPAP